VQKKTGNNGKPGAKSQLKNAGNIHT